MSRSRLLVKGDSSTVTRRRWLLAVAGGAAACGGAYKAWQNYLAPGMVARSNPTLWQREFQNLDGSQFHLASLRGKPLLLNFWATWCPPCIEELPMLSRFHQRSATDGWQVLGLAIDQLMPVRQFLARAPVSFPVVIAGVGGLEFGRSLGNPSNSLPFTVAIAKNGELVQRKIGRMVADDLRALALMTPTIGARSEAPDRFGTD